MNRNNYGLLDKLGPDWGYIASLSEELRHVWLSEHFDQIASLSQIDRRQHLSELMEETQTLDEEHRFGLLRAALLAIVDQPDDKARTIIQTWQRTMDEMTSDIAIAEVVSLQQAAHTIPVEDWTRLSEIWPRIFGRNLPGSL
jgi:hypothetical protein